MWYIKLRDLKKLIKITSFKFQVRVPKCLKSGLSVQTNIGKFQYFILKWIKCLVPVSDRLPNNPVNACNHLALHRNCQLLRPHFTALQTGMLEKYFPATNWKTPLSENKSKTCNARVLFVETKRFINTSLGCLYVFNI